LPFSTHHRILFATAIFAAGVPVAASAVVGHRTRALADHLGAAAGVDAHIGTVDADLTGRIRLTDVALGTLFTADAIEASVALDSLLSGQLGADEIRVAGPRVALEIDRSGDSDLARLVRRLAHASSGAASSGSGSAAHAPRLRRIVVSSGTLVAHVAGLGELSADGVELVPDAGGVRVITGPLRVRGEVGQLHGELELARSAAEVSLPHVKFGRVLAVAGRGSVVAGDRTISLRDVAIGRLAPGGSLEIRAALDDGGIPRVLSAELASDLSLTLRGDRVPLRTFAAIAPHAIALDDARATGSLTVKRTALGIQLAVDGRLDGARLDHRTIGAQPITVGGAIRGNLTVSPDAYSLDHVALDIGAAHWTASGWWRRGQPASGQLDVALAQAPCNDLLASLPAEIRGPLDGMMMTGTFGGRAHVGVDLAAPVGDGVELASDLDNRCVVTTESPAADPTVIAGQGVQVFADGSHAHVGKGIPGWVELHHIPHHVARAFVSAEDARFFDHHGFDPAQIAKSFEIDLRDRRLARGGSTISQQVVKNVYLTQRRSLDRKIQEAILTWRLEARLDKRTILERYLNIIELGPHVFGIGAAAKYWFGVTPRDLNLRQAAFLAALTSEPRTMSRRVRHASGLDPDSATRTDVILRAMYRDGVIDKDGLELARATPLAFASTALRGEP
jgi:hypothetical protein